MSRVFERPINKNDASLESMHLKGTKVSGVMVVNARHTMSHDCSMESRVWILVAATDCKALESSYILRCYLIVCTALTWRTAFWNQHSSFLHQRQFQVYYNIETSITSLPILRHCPRTMEYNIVAIIWKIEEIPSLCYAKIGSESHEMETRRHKRNLYVAVSKSSGHRKTGSIALVS